MTKSLRKAIMLFMLNYSARPKKSILVILISKAFLTTKNSEKSQNHFSNKGLNTNNIILVENNETVCEKEIIANIMSNHSTNIATSLNSNLPNLIPKQILKV